MSNKKIKKRKISTQRQVRELLEKLHEQGHGKSRHEHKSRDDFYHKSPYIHTTKTLKSYQGICSRFVSWCIETNRADAYASIKELGAHAEAYIQERNESGKISKSTLKTERAALGRILNRVVEFEGEYNKIEITRSRGIGKESRNARLNKKNNELLINVALGTGGRRADLQKLKASDFQEINGTLYVSFNKSKGGKDRMAPVLEQYRPYIEEHLKMIDSNERLFNKPINSNADIHAFRRDYATELYKQVKNDKSFGDKILKDLNLPSRKNFKYERGVASSEYESPTGFKGKRDDIYVVTRALGHNRLNVAVNHYLKDINL